MIVLRTAATNVADMLTHTPFHLAYSWTLAGLEAVQVLAVVPVTPRPTDVPNGRTRPAANGWYWFSLLAAGALGTALGDCTAEQFGLGTGLATLVLLVPCVVLLLAGARSGWSGKPSYWLTVVAIRAAGTTAGDWLAFPDDGIGLGLPLSTALTCGLLILFLLVWRPIRSTVGESTHAMR